MVNSNLGFLNTNATKIRTVMFSAEKYNGNYIAYIDDLPTDKNITVNSVILAGVGSIEFSISNAGDFIQISTTNESAYKYPARASITIS